MEDVFTTLNLSDDNEIFREDTTMIEVTEKLCTGTGAIKIELYNTLKFVTMLFSIKKILRFYLDVAFLKSVSIYCSHIEYFVYVFVYYVISVLIILKEG